MDAFLRRVIQQRAEEQARDYDPSSERGKWDRTLIAEGHALVRQCLQRNRPGPYQLQAAIQAVHRRYDETWARSEPAPQMTPTRYVLGDMVEGQLAPETPPPAPKVKQPCWCCGKVRLVVPSKFPKAACKRCSSLSREQMLEKFRARQLKDFREKTGT
jgi:hypothetical protein